MALVEIDHSPIDDQWPSRMIGNEAVVLEADGVWLPAPRVLQSFPFAWSLETGGALSVLLHIFKFGMFDPL